MLVSMMIVAGAMIIACICLSVAAVKYSEQEISYGVAATYFLISSLVIGAGGIIIETIF